MAFTQAQLPAQFTALINLSAGDYASLTSIVATIAGVQVGNMALACAASHVLELTLRGSKGWGVGPTSSMSGLDTSVSWAVPDITGTSAWWKSTAWGVLYLASRETRVQSFMMVAT